MDLFTKWPEVYTIPDQKAMTVVDVLVTNFFCIGVLRKQPRLDLGDTRPGHLTSECARHYFFASTVGWHDDTLM
jgi:hypothetical protein